MSFASLALVALASLQTPPAPAIRYRVVPDPKTSTWHVEMSIPSAPSAPFELWVPRWTPGAYHTADFGQFAEDVEAKNGDGKALAVEEIAEPVHWKVDPAGAKQVEVRYQAKHASEGPFDLKRLMLDMEANRVRKKWAYLTPPSLLTFVPELRDRPIDLELVLPSEWKVATPLSRNAEGRFVAPSWYRLEDSPFLMGEDLKTLDFEAEGIPHQVAILGKNPPAIDRVAEDCKRIVSAGKAMMGSLPYDHYVFLFAFPAEGGSGALEHSYCALFMLSGGIPRAELRHIIAHEYFHLWNAERVHVEALEKPDQTKPFESGTIWMNEGATEYLSALLLVHAGLTKRDAFFETMAEKYSGIREGMMASVVKRHSNTEASRMWKDASARNFMDVTVITYERGAVNLFAADLAIRASSKGERGLIDVVRLLYDRYAKNGKGYPEDSLPSIFSEVAGADMSDFFKRYIDGREIVELDSFLAPIGMKVTDRGIGESDDATKEQLALREKFFSLPPAAAGSESRASR